MTYPKPKPLPPTHLQGLSQAQICTELLPHAVFHMWHEGEAMSVTSSQGVLVDLLVRGSVRYSPLPPQCSSTPRTPWLSRWREGLGQEGRQEQEGEEGEQEDPYVVVGG